MHPIIQWSFDHRATVLYTLIWLVSLLGQTMPPPTEKNGQSYIWFYNILQLLGANKNLMKLPNSMPKPQAPPPGA